MEIFPRKKNYLEKAENKIDYLIFLSKYSDSIGFFEINTLLGIKEIAAAQKTKLNWVCI